MDVRLDVRAGGRAGGWAHGTPRSIRQCPAIQASLEVGSTLRLRDFRSPFAVLDGRSVLEVLHHSTAPGPLYQSERFVRGCLGAYTPRQRKGPGYGPGTLCQHSATAWATACGHRTVSVGEGASLDSLGLLYLDRLNCPPFSAPKKAQEMNQKNRTAKSPCFHIKNNILNCPHFKNVPLSHLLRGGGGGTRKRHQQESTGRSGRQKVATRRNMRREERVTVQGPVKEQQPDGMSHGGSSMGKILSGKIQYALLWRNFLHYSFMDIKFKLCTLCSGARKKFPAVLFPPTPFRPLLPL